MAKITITLAGSILNLTMASKDFPDELGARIVAYAMAVYPMVDGVDGKPMASTPETAVGAMFRNALVGVVRSMIAQEAAAAASAAAVAAAEIDI
jgi:hypothetical protein